MDGKNINFNYLKTKLYQSSVAGVFVGGAAFSISMSIGFGAIASFIGGFIINEYILKDKNIKSGLKQFDSLFSEKDNITLININEFIKFMNNINDNKLSLYKSYIKDISFNIQNFLDNNNIVLLNHEFNKFKKRYNIILNLDNNKKTSVNNISNNSNNYINSNDYITIKLNNGSSLVKEFDKINIKLNNGSIYEINGLNNISIRLNNGSKYKFDNGDIFIYLNNGSKYSKVGNTYSQKLNNGNQSNQYDKILDFDFLKTINDVLIESFSININLEENLKSYTNSIENKDVVNRQDKEESLNAQVKTNIEKKIEVNSHNVLSLLEKKFETEPSIIESINFIKDSSFLKINDLNNIDLKNDQNSIYDNLINLYKTTENYNIFSDETKKEYLILINDSLSNLKSLINEKNITYEKHYLKNLKIVNKTMKYSSS